MNEKTKQKEQNQYGSTRPHPAPAPIYPPKQSKSTEPKLSLQIFVANRPQNKARPKKYHTNQPESDYNQTLSFLRESQ